MWPSPQGHPFQLGPPSSPLHPEFTITLLFQQKGGRERERQGCACLLLPGSPLRAPSLPDRKPAPESQPAAALPRTPPPHLRPTESHSAQRPARAAAPPRLLGAGPRRPAGQLPGAASAHRPLLQVPDPFLPDAGPTLASVADLLGRGETTKSLTPSPLASDSEKAWDTGAWVSKGLCSGQPEGKGQKPGLESQPGGRGGWEESPPHLTLSGSGGKGKLELDSPGVSVRLTLGTGASLGWLCTHSALAQPHPSSTSSA
jgi:hypothetical protein